MTNELSKDLADDVTRQFEAGLAKVKYDYQKNLQDLDPLNKESLEKMLTVFNQRLVIFQHEFLEYLSKVRGGVNPLTEDFNVEAPPIERIPEMAASIIAAGGSVLLLTLIPVGTSGWWLWATTVSAAASIGALIGAPVAVVTAGAGVIIGAAGGIAAATLMKKKRRKLIRKALVVNFDEKIAPQLRSWAQGKISKE